MQNFRLRPASPVLFREICQEIRMNPGMTLRRVALRRKARQGLYVNPGVNETSAGTIANLSVILADALISETEAQGERVTVVNFTINRRLSGQGQCGYLPMLAPTSTRGPLTSPNLEIRFLSVHAYPKEISDQDEDRIAQAIRGYCRDGPTDED